MAFLHEFCDATGRKAFAVGRDDKIASVYALTPLRFDRFDPGVAHRSGVAHLSPAMAREVAAHLNQWADDMEPTTAPAPVAALSDDIVNKVTAYNKIVDILEQERNLFVAEVLDRIRQVVQDNTVIYTSRNGRQLTGPDIERLIDEEVPF